MSETTMPRTMGTALSRRNTAAKTISLLLILTVASGSNAGRWVEIGRVDLKPDGTPTAHPGLPDTLFSRASISNDGRWVVFASDADDLVAGDTNGQRDVFVRDMVNESTARLNIRPDGSQTTALSARPAASADTRFVLFFSRDDQLVAGDTNFDGDQFLIDRDGDGDGVLDNGGETLVRVSLGDGGTEITRGAELVGGDLSDDGSIVAFATEQPLDAGDNVNLKDVYVHDRVTGDTSAASVSSSGQFGDDQSPDFFNPPIQIDAAGNKVGFTSEATNLVGGDTNSETDVFVRDRAGGTTLRASVGPGGFQIGRDSGHFDLSPDGGWVAFEQIDSIVGNDTNPNAADIHLHHLASGEVTRVDFDASVHSKGGSCCGNQFPLIASDAKVVAFRSNQLFPFDKDTQRTLSDVYVSSPFGLTQLTDFPIPQSEFDSWAAVPVGLSHNGEYLAIDFTVFGGPREPGLFLYRRDVILFGGFE